MIGCLVAEGKVSTHHAKTEDQLADLGIKHRHRNVIKRINVFKAQDASKLIVFRGRPSSSCARNTCVLIIFFSVLRSFYRGA